MFNCFVSSSFIYGNTIFNCIIDKWIIKQCIFFNILSVNNLFSNLINWLFWKPLIEIIVLYIFFNSKCLFGGMH